MSWPKISFAIALLCIGAPVFAERAIFAVATNFAETALNLADSYNEASDHEIVFAFGSTGKLYSQIVNGAPYDGFLAADQLRPKLLFEKGLGQKPFTYAEGLLVWWPWTEGELAPGKIAIANPNLAPYGRAAKEVLTNDGVWEDWQARLVLGENIGQTFAIIATGNASSGLVALSSVLSVRNSQPWQWSEAKGYEPIRQDAILLNRGTANPAASGFLEYIKSVDARAKIESFGYKVMSYD